MILTVTLNPAIDKTYVVKNFEPYALNRASRVIINAGSKGINVSRVVVQLGQKTCALGFAGGVNGQLLLSELSAEGVEEDLVRVDGNTRLNIKIMDNVTKKVTEINEIGEGVSNAELNLFMSSFERHMQNCNIIVISGSILPNMANHIYYDLIKIAEKHQKPVFLDCGGALLKESVKASPYLIKPNLKEFAMMFGKETLTQDEVIKNAKEIIHKYGVKHVVVTLGRDGAIGITDDKCYKITPPNVEVVSTVGAGDAFLAGMCHGMLKGLDFKKQLILATSCSNAKVTKEGNNVPSLIELLGYTDGARVIEV